MASVNKYVIGPKTSFWIYNMTKSNYNDFIKYDGAYLSFFENNAVKSGDIILLYLKALRTGKSGFFGFVQSAGRLIENSNDVHAKNVVKIFKNLNLNNYTLKIKYKLIFNEIIELKKIISHIKTDATGYKTPASFVAKFTKNENNIMAIPLYGSKMIEKLIFENNMNDSTNDTEINDYNECGECDGYDECKDCDVGIVKSKKPAKDASKKLATKSVKTVVKAIAKAPSKTPAKVPLKIRKGGAMIIKDDEQQDNSNGHAEYETDNEENISDESDESNESDEDLNDVNGYIPILMIPCDDFKLPSTKILQYIVNHYKKCDICDITNNNNRELSSIIDNAKIEYVEIIDEKSGYFDPVLDAYWGLYKYEPVGVTQYPFARISYINNGHDIYNKCILIAWADKQN